MSTFDKVKELLANQLNIDEEKITMDSNVIADLGADSLDLFEILIALEDEFNITVPEEKVNDIKTVGQLVGYIDEEK
ncbi:MAG: acyl carrier protein [Clostridia bacterium]|nr:acyl carrier protein [Clostridia bacterium]MBR2069804.1 acyl carrier protein [Clostridia bacterium]MBR2160763.1 acyl carrier protein [Clostridia bacterium]MBR2874465.1 acyl carrier protein [Clostridia bacterium]